MYQGYLVFLMKFFLTKANVRKWALSMFYLYHNNINNVQSILENLGYSGDKFAKSVYKILYCPVEIAKRNTLDTFLVIPKIMDSSFAWLENIGDYGKNCE